MLFLKTALSAAAMTLFVGTGALVTMTAPAAARMVCNGENDCWHTDSPPAVPGVRFSIHPDDWYFHQKWDGGDRHYRDYHEGRGYYKGGVWITL